MSESEINRGDIVVRKKPESGFTQKMKVVNVVNDKALCCWNRDRTSEMIPLNELEKLPESGIGYIIEL